MQLHRIRRTGVLYAYIHAIVRINLNILLIGQVTLIITLSYGYEALSAFKLRYLFLGLSERLSLKDVF
jgi:hypothetical protein